MIFDTTIKGEGTILVVGTNMEAETLILVKLKSNVVVPIAIIVNPFPTVKDVGLNVRVEVIEAMVIKERM
jgi:hypothetical protein